MIKQLKDEKFEEEVQEGKVLVDFYATWCGPCKMLAPVLEEVSKDNEDLKIIEVDIDEHEELARKFGIMSVPTLQVYKDGSKISEHTGYVTKNVIESWYK